MQNTTQAVARYANPSEAMAAGYVAVSPTDYPVVYYVNPTIVAANAAAKKTLDPNSIDGLVYAQTPAGTEVLAAAMYILPSTLTSPPMPYGPLVQWHQRTEYVRPVPLLDRRCPQDHRSGALCRKARCKSPRRT